MEYKTVLKVSDSELYYALLDSVVGEASAATGKTLTYKDLEGGYKYRRRLESRGKSVETVTHIKQPIEKKKIQINFDDTINQYTMTYEINAIDENKTEVIFNQVDKYPYKNSIQKWKFKNGMKKKFKQVERFIVSKRSK